MQSIASRSKRCLDFLTAAIICTTLFYFLFLGLSTTFVSVFFLTIADIPPGPSLGHYSHDQTFSLARHINSGAAWVGDWFRS